MDYPNDRESGARSENRGASTDTRKELFAAVEAGDSARATDLLRTAPELLGAREPHYGRTPLHVAAAGGDLAVVRALLRAGADTSARDEGDRATALHFAADGGHVEVAKLLLDHGADPDARDDLHGRGPIGWAVALERFHPEVAELLRERGARVDVFTAVALGHGGLVRELAAADPAVLESRMSAFEHGMRPLHLAARRGRTEMVGILLDLGADPYARTTLSATPACIAALEGHLPVVELLQDRGVASDAGTALVLGGLREAEARLAEAPGLLGPEGEFRTLLHLMAERNRPKAVAFLLEHGSDPSAKATIYGAEGLTPLHLAAGYGHQEVVRLLAERGADLAAREGEFGSTPAGWARAHGQEGIARFLEERASGSGGAVPGGGAS